MKKIIKVLYLFHKNFWTKEIIFSLFIGIILLIIASFIQRIANNYVIITGWTIVWDILLSNIPSFDIDKFIIIGALCFTFMVILLLLLNPKYINFTIKSLALFIIIRSFFISLTHLWIQPHEIKFDSNTIGFWLYDILYNTKNDFFFSGHTGIPFLIALIFHKRKVLRNFFFLLTIISWTSVILGHIHYSIDVFSAPFITYSIYSISKSLFKKDYELIIKKSF